MRFRNMLHDSTKFPSQYLALFLTNFPSLLFSDRKLGLIVCKCKVPHRLALRQAPLLATLLALIVVLDLSDEPESSSSSLACPFSALSFLVPFEELAPLASLRLSPRASRRSAY